MAGSQIQVMKPMSGAERTAGLEGAEASHKKRRDEPMANTPRPVPAPLRDLSRRTETIDARERERDCNK
jgi:hypothetical protein